MSWAHLHTLLGDYICLLGSSNESNIHKLEKWPCAFHSCVCIKIKYVRCSSLCKRPAFDIWLRGFLVIFLCIGGFRVEAESKDHAPPTTHPRTPTPLFVMFSIISEEFSVPATPFWIFGSAPDFIWSSFCVGLFWQLRENGIVKILQFRP